MTSKFNSDTIPPGDGMGDVLSRVRQLDAMSDEAEVQGYVREMAEAEAVLDTVDLADAPLPVSYSPTWPEGAVR